MPAVVFVKINNGIINKQVCCVNIICKCSASITHPNACSTSAVRLFPATRSAYFSTTICVLAGTAAAAIVALLLETMRENHVQIPESLFFGVKVAL